MFNDHNGDGQFDHGNMYAVGTRVFLDANGDSILDDGEVSVLTSKGGRFALCGLPAGTYRMRAVFAKAYAAGMAVLNVTLASGQVRTGLTIGAKRT